MEAFFIDYHDHVLNVAEIRTISPSPGGVHIDYRHGGFTDIDGGSKDELLSLMREAQKALAPF